LTHSFDSGPPEATPSVRHERAAAPRRARRAGRVAKSRGSRGAENLRNRPNRPPLRAPLLARVRPASSAPPRARPCRSACAPTCAALFSSCARPSRHLTRAFAGALGARRRSCTASSRSSAASTCAALHASGASARHWRGGNVRAGGRTGFDLRSRKRNEPSSSAAACVLHRFLNRRRSKSETGSALGIGSIPFVPPG
jgi:hypothetical protein